MKLQKKSFIAFMLNVIIVILESIGFVLAIGNNGWSIFRFYTQDSNLILLLCSLTYVILWLSKKGEELPHWVTILKYLATSLVMVTFVVVILVLEPMCYPDKTLMWNVLVGEANLYHHMLCPMLAIVSFLFFEKHASLSRKDNVIATIPTFFYATITTILNALKIMYGPYPFLYVYEQPVWASILWFLGIVGAGYLFAFLLRKLLPKNS